MARLIPGTVYNGDSRSQTRDRITPIRDCSGDGTAVWSSPDLISGVYVPTGDTSKLSNIGRQTRGFGASTHCGDAGLSRFKAHVCWPADILGICCRRLSAINRIDCLCSFETDGKLRLRVHGRARSRPRTSKRGDTVRSFHDIINSSLFTFVPLASVSLQKDLGPLMRKIIVFRFYNR